MRRFFSVIVLIIILLMNLISCNSINYNLNNKQTKNNIEGDTSNYFSKSADNDEKAKQLTLNTETNQQEQYKNENDFMENNNDVSTSENKEEINEKKALNDAKNLISLIKLEDIDKLIELLKDDFNYDQSMMYEVIDGFKKVYDVNTLEVIPYYEGNNNPDFGQYHFHVKEEKNKKEILTDLMVLYNLYNNNKLNYYHVLINYYPRIDDNLNRYISLIQQQDVEKLAGFLSVDDDPKYYMETAEEIINKYSNNFDLKSMTFKYLGYENSHFLYQLEDMKGNTNIIKIIYGDGLLGIRDKYNPNYR